MIRRIDDASRHLERVDMVAGRECKGVVSERIALIVVGDGIGKVDGISGVLLQTVLQLHLNAAPLTRDFGLFKLRWRHDNLFRRVVELYIFIEKYRYLLSFHARCLVGRCGTENPRRRLVEPSAIRIAHLCARREQQRHDSHRAKRYFLNVSESHHIDYLLFISSSSSMFLRLFDSLGILC